MVRIEKFHNRSENCAHFSLKILIHQCTHDMTFLPTEDGIYKFMKFDGSVLRLCVHYGGRIKCNVTCDR